jgi:hypothetical protein
LNFLDEAAVFPNFFAFPGAVEEGRAEGEQDDDEENVQSRITPFFVLAVVHAIELLNETGVR